MLNAAPHLTSFLLLKGMKSCKSLIEKLVCKRSAYRWSQAGWQFLCQHFARCMQSEEQVEVRPNIQRKFGEQMRLRWIRQHQQNEGKRQGAQQNLDKLSVCSLFFGVFLNQCRNQESTKDSLLKASLSFFSHAVRYADAPSNSNCHSETLVSIQQQSLRSQFLR